MSGFIKNDWKSYLNGSTSQYNFSYKSEVPSVPIESIPAPMSTPVVPVTPIVTQNTIESKKNNKNNKVVIPAQKGGKRKSRRVSHSHKKYRYSRRK